MKPLLSLCANPVTVLRDGYSGANAKLLIPFIGYFFASGQHLVFPGSRGPQASGTRMGGIKMIDNYAKDCCDCNCNH